MPDDIIPDGGQHDGRRPGPNRDAAGSCTGDITKEQYIRKYMEEHKLPGAYLEATKAGKTEILDRAVQALGVHRKSMIRRLNRGSDATPRGNRTGRPRLYSDAVRNALIDIWRTLDEPAERQLVGSLPPWIEAGERFEELQLSPEVVAELLEMSSATAGRIVRDARPRRRSGERRSRPHSQVQADTPLRTWREWSDVKPGEVQVDSVWHAGGAGGGTHLYTLAVIDPATGWTVARSSSESHPTRRDAGD